MNDQQIEELFSDEVFMESLLELETPEGVQKALSDKGLDLSLEEITTIRDALLNNEGELSDGQLESISGGSVAGIVANILNDIVMPVVTFPAAVFRRRW